MNEKQFKEIEARYQELKRDHELGKINADFYKQELKKLMLQDEKGRYWMIGGKSGSWYVYDNNEWKSSMPYEADEPKEEPVVLESEHAVTERATTERIVAEPAKKEVEAPVIARDKEHEKQTEELTCRFCNSKIQRHAQFCPFCGGNQKKIVEEKGAKTPEGIVEIKSIRVFSLIAFLGCIGMVVGVVCGAIFGIFSLGGDLLFQFPMLLQEQHGKMTGGFIFGAVGGIGGFIAFAFLAAVFALLYNAVALFVGGVRVRLKQ